jgi:PAS domain S-box-containing protein
MAAYPQGLFACHAHCLHDGRVPVAPTAMPRLLIACALLWLLLRWPLAMAEDFQRLGVDDGLPSATLYGVVQDRAGFLWISGASGGLARYDGHEFRFVPLLDAAEAGGVLPDTGTLLLDGEDRLWIGTWGHGLLGLGKDRREVSHYREGGAAGSELSGDFVQALHADRRGNLWVGGTSGLDRIDPSGRASAPRLADGSVALAGMRIWSLADDGEEGIWVGASDGLYHLLPDQGRLRRFQPLAADAADPRAFEVRALHRDERGLWAGTRHGLQRFDPATGRFQRFSAAAGVAGEVELAPVSAILGVPGEQLLLGTQAGVLRFDIAQQRFLPFAADTPGLAALPHSNVCALLADRSGVLWVATRESGLYRLVPGRQRFQTLRARFPGLPTEIERLSATALAVDGEGTLWLAGPEGVLALSAGAPPRALPAEDGAPVPGPILSLVPAADGRLWIGSHQGLYERAPGSATARRVRAPFIALGIDGESVRALQQDADGSLLIGLWGRGALRWHPRHGSSHWLLQELGGQVGDAVFAFAGDAARRYIGTRYSGLRALDASGKVVEHWRFEPTQPARSLPNNTVNALLEDTDGALWIGTDQGLALRDPGSGALRVFGLADGLPDARIVGLHRDADGRVWALTKRGLVRIDERGERVVAFTRNDGLQASELNPGGIASDGQGRLLVATVEGVNLFRPSQLVANTVPPGMQIIELRVDGEALPLPAPDEPPRVTIPPGKRSLSIGFVALDFQDPSRHRFRYRLGGFDEDWRNADRGRYATYTNLPIGRYRFEVLGSNNHGRWAAAPATLELDVLGPWWQRGGVQLAGAAGLLALLLGGYRLRLRQHERARLALEAQVARYAGELRAERDLFVAGPAVAVIAELAEGWPLRYVSANAEALFGQAASRLSEARQPLLALVHPADRERVAAQARQALAEGRAAWDQRFRLVRADGGVREVFANLVAQRDAEGRADALSGYLLDQTALLSAQRASEQFRQTLDRIRDPVLMFDAGSLRFQYANQGALDLLGHGREDILGMPAHAALGTGDEAALRHLLAPLARSADAAITFRSEARRRDGQSLPVEIFLQYVAGGEDGGRFVAFVRDIRERLRVERLKDEFVATVSHELRTPLTSIHGALGLALGGALGALPEPATALLNVAHRNTQRLRLLIDDLLDIEKLEAGELRVALQRCALLPLLQQAIEANRDFAAQWRVRLALHCQGEQDVEAMVDPARLQQVLANLLSNAAKFSPPGEVVELRLCGEAETVRISVVDHGPGIPEAFWPRVFEKFSQADASDTRDKAGTGLGLAITRQLVERMRGRVHFETAAGRGTVFHVDLPRASG